MTKWQLMQMLFDPADVGDSYTITDENGHSYQGNIRYIKYLSENRYEVCIEFNQYDYIITIVRTED